MNHISVGFSIHRPEIVPVTARIMEQYDVIFLEEPPEDGFENMLNSSLGVEDYLMPLDLEYPEFSRSMCYLERELYAKGKKLIQVEPFVEALLSVHDFFAQGNKPGQIRPASGCGILYGLRRLPVRQAVTSPYLWKPA